MIDIVQRLRNIPPSHWPLASTNELCAEAAAEIERLRVVSDGHKKECIKLEACLEALRDEIERLRKSEEGYSRTLYQAANEIDRLRNANDSLRRQLEKFQEYEIEMQRHTYAAKQKGLEEWFDKDGRKFRWDGTGWREVTR